MKILIITNAFPPLNSIASLRPYSWAKYWSLAGHEVCVLTTEKTSSSGRLDLKMDPAVEKRIKIYPVPFFVFRKSVGENLTAKSDTQPDQDKKIMIARKMIRVLRKTIFGSFLDSRIFWIGPATRQAKDLYRNWKFDLVVSTYDPPAAHIIASEIQRSLGVKWVADYRDLWVGSHIERPIFPLNYFEKWIEEFTVRRAFLISTVSDILREKLQKRFRQRVITIENGYDEDDYILNDIQFEFPPDGCKRILYTGKINKGKQDPAPLFQALAALQKQGKIKKGQIEVLFYGQWLEHLPDLIKKYEVTDFVSVMGFLDREKILRMQKAADLLLFLEFNAPGVDGILTGKLFEYMISGRPVLGIGMDESKATAILIQKAGVGEVFGSDPQPIQVFIEGFIAGEPVHYAPDKEGIQRYSRRRLAEKMLNEMTTGSGLDMEITR